MAGKLEIFGPLWDKGRPEANGYLLIEHRGKLEIIRHYAREREDLEKYLQDAGQVPMRGVE
jgi:hypothetical protein